MTIAIPRQSVSGRHRREAAGSTYLLVTPPRGHRPTSHRRSRTRLMQLSVDSFVRPHGPVVERVPAWARAGRFAVEWVARW